MQLAAAGQSQHTAPTGTHWLRWAGTPPAQPPTTRQTPSACWRPRICFTMGLQWPMQSSTRRALISVRVPLPPLPLPLLWLACTGTMLMSAGKGGGEGAGGPSSPAAAAVLVQQRSSVRAC